MLSNDRKLIAVIGATGQLWALLLRKGRKTEPWAGLFLLIQLCVAFTWATSLNLATLSPAHSHARMRQAMASICPWLVIL